MSEELKQCPFCGEEPKVEINIYDHTLNRARCTNVKCSIGCLGDDDWPYVWAWNTRAQSPDRAAIERAAETIIKKLHISEYPWTKDVIARILTEELTPANTVRREVLERLVGAFEQVKSAITFEQLRATKEARAELERTK